MLTLQCLPDDGRVAPCSVMARNSSRIASLIRPRISEDTVLGPNGVGNNTAVLELLEDEREQDVGTFEVLEVMI